MQSGMARSDDKLELKDQSRFGGKSETWQPKRIGLLGIGWAVQPDMLYYRQTD